MIAFAVLWGVFIAVGLLLAGDPSAQWWLSFLPAVLLVGPMLRVARRSRGRNH